MRTLPLPTIAPAVALPLVFLLTAGPALSGPPDFRPQVLEPAVVVDDAGWLPDIRSGLLTPPVIDMLAVPGTEIAPESPQPDIIPIDRESVVAPDDLRVRAFPNPSDGPVTVRAEDTAAVSVRVYDVSGRMLAGLDGPGGEVVWDGRDAQGRPAPSGVYFARVRAEGASAETIRIVRR